MWYMSAVGAPTDYDYSDGTATSAVAGTSGEQAGRVGFEITALCAYRDDYMVFGGAGKLAVLMGDPMYGGYIDTVSQQVGIVSANAWCYGLSGELYFLDQFDGMYMLPPGGRGVPESLSRPKLPEELVEIDPKLVWPSMAYSHVERGIHIWLTPITSGTTYHWFYDLSVGAFFRDSFESDHESFSHALSEGSLLFGCRDGYVRRFDESAETDDGTNIDSYADYGPFRLAGNDTMRGYLKRMDAVLADKSGDVTWSIRQGDSFEQAVRASTFKTGTWSGGGLTYATRPAMSGSAAVLRFGNSAARKWAMDRLTVQLDAGGKMRR
jgi:hypothetical protein